MESASKEEVATTLTIASIVTDGSKKKKPSPPTTSLKLAILDRAVDLLTRFRNLYKDLPALKAAFSVTRYFLTKLPASSGAATETTLPKELGAKIQTLLNAVGGGEGETEGTTRLPKLTRLRRPKPRPQALPQFEPKFDMEFDGRKRFAGDQARKDKLRLERQYKMEFKAAAKDLRQDAAFLANVKISEQIAKDKKRQAKVREIYGQLAAQEGEHKEMERMKKRK